ncbi:MAG: hypothetical protein ABFD62_06585 [Syntrophaceae bacterium]
MLYSSAINYLKVLQNESKALCDGFGIPVTGNPFGHNDARDAFRHAYSSAVVAYENSALISQILGDLNELKGEMALKKKDRQSNEELNMDLWNNRIGREIGQNATSREEIAQKVYEALQNGSLITSLSDTRDWGGLTYGAPLNSLTPIGTAEAAFAAAAVAQRRDPLVVDLDGDAWT